MIVLWILEGQVDGKNQIGNHEPGKKVDFVLIINQAVDKL